MIKRCKARMATVVSAMALVGVACSGGAEATRSMAVAHQIAFSVELKARREAAERTIGPGGSVTDGDWIYATIRPAEDVYVYLGFCNGADFVLFPQPGSFRAPAGSVTRIPPENDGLKVNGDSASEVLYLIVSQGELSAADPDLAIKIDAARRDGRSAAGRASPDGDCAKPRLDSAGKPIPLDRPVPVRPSSSAIEVRRYELAYRASARR